MLTLGRTARWTTGILAAAAAGVTAFFLSRTLLAPDEPAAPEIRPPTIPEYRPDIALADRSGTLRHLSEWDGKPLIINFWATWCAPCRREIPMLNALAREPAYAEFALIGIAVDFREDVLRYLEETPIEYDVLIGEQDGLDAARAFGMESIGLPFTAFTDKTGRLATLHVGELHRTQADAILAAVQAVNAGRMNMKDARDRIRAEIPKIE